jgi:hypothetical protein
MELHVTFPVKIIPGKDFHEHLALGGPIGDSARLRPLR